MKQLLSILLFPFAAMAGAIAQEQEPPKGEQAPSKPQEKQKEVAEKEQAKRLIAELEDVLQKTDAAHIRVRRVQNTIEQVQKLTEQESGKESAKGGALVATEELVTILKESLDRLYAEANRIRDQVRNDVVPEFNATTQKMKARLEVLKPTDARYKDLQEILDKAVQNQSKINDQLSRLDGNIKLLAETKADLLDKLNIFQLWKEVNLKGSELIEKLNEFNRKLEDIYHKLHPNPS